MYIDIGAFSGDEVRKAGVDVLSPIAISRSLFNLADAEFAGAAVGDRFGAAALLELLARIDPAKLKGTLTIAFVVQQRTGARGLQRILTTMQFDEMIYVGRLFAGGPVTGHRRSVRGRGKRRSTQQLRGGSETDRRYK
jgi:putative aminopeptidase FrvX